MKYIYIARHPSYDIWDDKGVKAAEIHFYEYDRYVRIIYISEDALNEALRVIRDIVLRDGLEFPIIRTLRAKV